MGIKGKLLAGGVMVVLIAFFIMVINIAIIATGMVTGADEIYCDWIVCSVSYKETKEYISHDQHCYRNGVEIPCEEFEEVIGNASNKFLGNGDTAFSFV